MLAAPRPMAVTIKTACEQLSLSKWMVYEMVRTGRLQAVKAGRRTLITTESMLDFINGR